MPPNAVSSRMAGASGSHDPLPRFGDRRRTRIGLLGGSFNPAHAGHRQVAEIARRRLRLHQIWLLVSPGNPLKPRAGMPPQAVRLASAQRVADGRRIVATGIEAQLGTRYTFDTLKQLRRRFPRARFVWLMGADNLQQLPRWRRWIGLSRFAAFAVLPRRPYTLPSLAGQAATRLGRFRLPVRCAPVLAAQPPPAWLFLPARLNPLSSSALREAAKGAVP